MIVRSEHNAENPNSLASRVLFEALFGFCGDLGVNSDITYTVLINTHKNIKIS